MPDSKISELPAATDLTNAQFAGIQGGVTKRFAGTLLGSGGGSGSSGPALGSAIPQMNGSTASPGTSGAAAREDHVHPSDSTKTSAADVRAMVNLLSDEAAGRAIVPADNGKELIYTGTTAASFQLPNTTGIARGFSVLLTQDNTGAATFTAGAGVTIENRRATGQFTTAARGATIYATYRGANLWVVSGDTGA